MTSPKSRMPVWGALLGSGFAGTLVALQSRINGGLSNELGNASVAAVVSFGSGMIIVAIAVVLSRRGRAGLGLVRDELRSRHLPWWALIGGLFGATFVMTQGLVATVIGLALFTVGIVAGQVFGGLVIDRFGLGPGGRVDPSLQRILGTVLATIAVVIAVLADLGSPVTGAGHLWLAVIPVIVGVGVSFQSTVNGLLRAAAHSATTATFISFVVGTAALMVAAIVSVAVDGWPSYWPSDLWLYSGGALGAIFIAIAAMLVRTAGVLLLSMSNVAGQLVASVVLETLVPLAGGVGVAMLVGAGVALIALVVAALPSRPTLASRSRPQ